jgi:hypothetical protein
MNNEKICMNCDNWSRSRNDSYFGICEYHTSRAEEYVTSYDHIADDCDGYFCEDDE